MRAAILLGPIVLAAASGLARADLLWDNGGFEEDAAYSSERNTLVPESWTVDDLVIASPVIVREFQWTTLRGWLEPVSADLIVLTSDFRTIVELRDLLFAQEWLGESSFGFDLYTITLTGLDIALDPGRYYIGGRMVGEGGGRSFNGLRREIRAETEAYIRSEFFGIPDWAPVTEGLGGPYDMVFAVYGDVVPAPATVAPLLCGFLARRRRDRTRNRRGAQRPHAFTSPERKLGWMRSPVLVSSQRVRPEELTRRSRGTRSQKTEARQSDGPGVVRAWLGEPGFVSVSAPCHSVCSVSSQFERARKTPVLAHRARRGTCRVTPACPRSPPRPTGSSPRR